MAHLLLKDLNPDQIKAVKYCSGPALILAGAGSGKTRVITYKIAYLIAFKKISPEAILALTFTNKAAEEMKKRIQKLTGQTIGFAGTFHSFAAWILRKDGIHIGISPNFVIYDEGDQKNLMKKILSELNLSLSRFKPPTVLKIINEAKNELIDELEYPQYVCDEFQHQIAQIYLTYQKLLRKNNALDFGDLLLKTVKLFKRKPEVLHKYQQKFEFIFVDEYHDTNHAQYELTKLLASFGKNLCVVADCSQSIYSWRGADFRNVLKLKNDFPNLKTFRLEQNYRSTQNILTASFAVISQNTSHPILKLWTENPKGDKILVYQARTEKEEAQFVSQEINSLVSSGNVSHYNQIAVLYRMNAQSRTVEETMIKNRLPYTLVGGVKFYERKEIKDLLSYLRLVLNPEDEIALKRAEKIGKRRLESFWKIRDQLISLSSFEILEKIIQATHYLDLYNPKLEEDLKRIENIKELYSVATEFPNLSQFLENVALSQMEYIPQDQPKTQKQNAVYLMTLHAAKGLEFEIVFIIGMEEGIFPHSKSLWEKPELEEERRLCYVGFTRAKKKLYLTYANRRLYFGTYINNPPSRFLLDIPQDLIEYIK
jgi:DNA helicase-2/ATP-dependent DNA helicase PcrA